MKKIISFIIFLPLLLFVIVLSFTQSKQKKNGLIMTSPTNSPTLSPSNPVNTSNSILPIASSRIDLIITTPASGTTTNASSVEVTGTTSRNSNVVINDQDLTSDNAGIFKAKVALDEGENYISIVAYDESGNVAEREILVTRSVDGL